MREQKRSSMHSNLRQVQIDYFGNTLYHLEYQDPRFGRAVDRTIPEPE